MNKEAPVIKVQQTTAIPPVNDNDDEEREEAFDSYLEGDQEEVKKDYKMEPIAVVRAPTANEDFEIKVPEVDEEKNKANERQKLQAKDQKMAKIFADKEGYEVCDLPDGNDDSVGEGEIEELKEVEPPEEKASELRQEDPFSEVPEEDRPFIVRDGDTGQYFDVRTMKVMQLTKTRRSASPKGKAWTSYWKTVRQMNQKLWDAAERGNGVVIKGLLDPLQQSAPANVNSRLLDDWTALHLAVNEGHTEVVLILLDHQAMIDARTKTGRTPLHIAALRGKLDVVTILVEKGAVLNPVDDDLNTPIHYASEYAQLDVVDYLLQRGADGTLRNRLGLTPPDVAGAPELLRLFTSKGYHVSDTIGEVKSNRSRDRIEEGRRTEDARMASGRPSHDAMYRIKILSRIGTDSQILKPRVGPHSFVCHYLLGKGSFGEVFLVEKIDSKKLYAMKVLRKDKIVNQNLTRYAKTERSVLSLMNHPFIVRLNFAFQTDTKLYLILDYCPGGDLGSLITRKKRLTEDVARIYLCEILLALEALHRCMIVFRDLKPDNVVLDDDGHALLTDFGLSKEGVDVNLSRSFCGSVAYLAPEMLKRSGHNRTVDWYLVGVLLYEMLVGIPPYFSSKREELFENILKAPLKLPRTMSEEAKDLIKRLLNRNPAQRLGANGDATEIKAHPFFKDVDWEEVANKRLKPPKPDKKAFRGPLINKPVNDTLPADPTKTRNHIPGWSFINE